MGCSCGKKKVAGGGSVNRVVKSSNGSVNKSGGSKPATKTIRRIIRRAAR